MTTYVFIQAWHETCNVLVGTDAVVPPDIASLVEEVHSHQFSTSNGEDDARLRITEWVMENDAKLCVAKGERGGQISGAKEDLRVVWLLSSDRVIADKLLELRDTME